MIEKLGEFGADFLLGLIAGACMMWPFLTRTMVKDLNEAMAKERKMFMDAIDAERESCAKQIGLLQSQITDLKERLEKYEKMALKRSTDYNG